MELKLLDQVRSCDGGPFPGDTDGSLPLQGPTPPLPSSSKFFSPRSPSLSSVSASVCLPSPGTFSRAAASKLCCCVVFPTSQARSAAGREVSRTCVFSHPRPPGHPAPSGGDTHPRLIHTLGLQLPQGGPGRDSHDSVGEKDAPPESSGSSLGHRQLVGQSRAIWQSLSSGLQAQVTAWLQQVGGQRVGPWPGRESLEKGKNVIAGHSVILWVQQSLRSSRHCDVPCRYCGEKQTGPPRQRGP